MRLKRLIAISLTLLCLLIVEDASAQRKNKYQKRKAKNKQVSHYRGGRVSSSRFAPYSFVGVNLNALNYFGDLAPVNTAMSTDVSFTKPGAGVFYGRKFHHSMSYRVAFNYGRILGDDNTSDPNGGESAPGRYARNLSFRNDIKELSATIQIDLLPNYGGPQSRMLINGYVFFGAAVIHQEPKGLVPDYDHQTYGFTPPDGTPKLENAGEWVKLRPLGTEGQKYGVGQSYSPFQVAVPFGVGGEVFLNSNLNIGVEFGIRKLFFDHLDDVSGTYFDLGAFDASDELARIMSDRSAESIAIISGQNRSLVSPNVNLGTGFANGESYYHNSNSGTGLPSNKNRGGPANDLYFMTSIRLVYVLNNSRKAKHR